MQHPGSETPRRMIDAIADAMPEYTETEIEGWSESDRSVSGIRVVLVRLTPSIAEMTHTRFCEAIMDPEATAFRELVEVHGTKGDGDPVYRVSGTMVDDAPRYFRDSVTAAVFLHGLFARDNIGIALYDDDTFAESVYSRIDSYRLFTPDDRQNRVAEIRDVNMFMDKFHSSQFQQHLEELVNGDGEDVDEFLTDHTDPDSE